MYNLHNIYKVYEIQFYPVRNKNYWFTYTNPNFIPSSQMCHKQSEIPLLVVSIIKWMNQLINKQKQKICIIEIIHIDNNTTRKSLDKD